MDISRAVTIVTGASSGIGLATARLFTLQGARVVLVARSADILTQIAQDLPDSLVVPTDMRDIAAIRQMVATVQQHYGRIDILVNNAGQGMHVPIEHADIEMYRALLDLNVVGVLAAMQAVIPIMRAQGGGQIINISSGLSKRIVPNVGPYASTKYTLNALSLTARLELAPDNIRVGVVYPGITATNFSQNAIGGTHLSAARQGNVNYDSAEVVAAKILTAVQTEEAETYADSIAPRL